MTRESAFNEPEVYGCHLHVYAGLLCISLLALITGCAPESKPEAIVVVEEVVIPDNVEDEDSEEYLSQYSAAGFFIDVVEDMSYIQMNIAHMPNYTVRFHDSLPSITDHRGEEHGIDRIAISSTTFIPYIKALGLESNLVASSWADHILDEELADCVLDGTISDLSRGESLDMEQLALADVDVLFYDPAEGELDKQAARIGVLGIPIQEYKELHPMARADWLRCFGALLGKNKEADLAYQKIEEEYLGLIARADSSKTRPNVLMGSTYKGKWYAPAAESLAGAWVTDAGGRYVLEKEAGQSTITLSMEELIALGADTDWIGQMGFGPYDHEATIAADKRLKQIEALTSGQVFYCDTEKEDYFGQAILEPQVILADILSILHPDLLLDRELVYFHPIADSLRKE